MKFQALLAFTAATAVTALSGKATTTVCVPPPLPFPFLFLFPPTPISPANQKTRTTKKKKKTRKLLSHIQLPALLRRPRRGLRLRLLLGRLQLATGHRERRVHGRGLAGALRLVRLDVVRRRVRHVLPADQHGVLAVLDLWHGRRQRGEHHRHGDEFVSEQWECPVVSCGRVSFFAVLFSFPLLFSSTAPLLPSPSPSSLFATVRGMLAWMSPAVERG